MLTQVGATVLASTLLTAGAVIPAPAVASSRYHYIVGLDPTGDDWLALRSEPSFTKGRRLTKMGPDTLLVVLGRSGDWIRVQTQTAEIGWASAKHIACCRTAPSDETSEHVYSPAPGSPEEEAILRAVRPSIEANLHRPVQLTAKKIRIVGNFAHADVVPREADGNAIRIRRPDWMDAYADAVLEKRQGRWSVLQAVLGPTDVWYCGFQGRVPKALLKDC